MIVPIYAKVSHSQNQQDFIEFVLDKYIEIGVEELKQDKLPDLLKSKYQTLEDAKEVLGDVKFYGFSDYSIAFAIHLHL
jgi:type I restriction enzyme R subunit